MHRLDLFLIALLGLTDARQTGFSIHDDVAAHPQFEVLFSETPIAEQEVQALLEQSRTHDAYSPQFSSHSGLTDGIREATQDDFAADAQGDGDIKVSETYEIMNLPPSKYICSIPVLQPPRPENQTVNELAKAEEARELTRATARGWELLSDLDGGCLYFMSGWWSYSFCYNREVVQFHALPSIPTGGPPMRDPSTAEYILGRVPTTPSGQRQPPAKQQQSVDGKPPNTELQVKGDQRYLVQRLDGGTVCDLTGRERTIEVQYHCVPGMKGDRIGWIKEVTTCTYLMVVNTPRLCADVAFLPPKETSANPITCRLILPPGDSAQSGHFVGKRLDSKEAARTPESHTTWQDPKGRQATGPPITIGGVIVGGRNLLSAGSEDGHEPPRLAPPRTYLRGRLNGVDAPLVETIASGKSKADGGQWEVLTRQQLEDMDLNPELVEEMRQELQRLAGEKGWKLEVVEAPGDPREIRGIIDVEGEESDGKDKPASGDDEGSEEKFFKEEL